MFVAGATGVIGVRLVPRLVAAGHEVAGLSRSVQRAEGLRALGATPVVGDVYDEAALTRAVVAFHPEMVIHQLTDLPDAAQDLALRAPGNARMRHEGTRAIPRRCPIRPRCTSTRRHGVPSRRSSSATPC